MHISWSGERGSVSDLNLSDAGTPVLSRPHRIDSVRTTLYNGSCISRVYPLIGGGVAEWLKAAVC
jgi:hypothetical protein